MDALSVVAVSGGMDSCVTLSIAAGKGGVAALHAKYGQRTEERELQAFHDVCDYYGVDKRLIVSLEYLGRIGGSSLTDLSIPVPETEPRSGGIPTTYVPFRNAHLLCVGVSWAEVIGAGAVYLGAVEQDSSGYPDCRRGFFDAFGKAVDTGTRPETEIRIVTPLISKSKSDIVKTGLQLKAPLHLTWSCYTRPVNGAACGTCESCRLRLNGFKEAGAVDPLEYVKKRGW
jgi:7-cyano-7-deazaguanine synthase